MKASKFITSLVITMFITIFLTLAISSIGRVVSNSQAMHVLSTNGSVQMENEVLRYTSNQWDLSTRELQALAQLSKEYDWVYVMEGEVQ